MSGGGGGGGGSRDNKTAKPVTTVHLCISTFVWETTGYFLTRDPSISAVVSLTPLDIEENSGRCPAVCGDKKYNIFSQEV